MKAKMAAQAAAKAALSPSDIPHTTLLRGMVWGLIGGFAGTSFMDLVLMGALLASGQSALTCYSIVGDTVARFSSAAGVELPGGVPLGVAAHYLIGPAAGALFGFALVKLLKVPRTGMLTRNIVYAIVYIEILAQPMLAAASFLLKMTAAETWLWFGGSFVMHFILAVVLGAVVSFGIRSRPCTWAGPDGRFRLQTR